MKIGASIGHFRIGAGTLGAFCRSLRDGRVLMLSNNHVLANENRAKLGDVIFQPGPLDGGTAADRVAALADFHPLKRSGANYIDAAVALPDPGVDYDPSTVEGFGNIRGLREPPLVPGDEVIKIGRTTGFTRGRVSAIEVDDLRIGYSIGTLEFDRQIEFEGVGADPFSQPGDSGSLILDANGQAAALLFSGSQKGGTNGRGLTYANELAAVLTALNVELLVQA